MRAVPRAFEGRRDLSENPWGFVAVVVVLLLLIVLQALLFRWRRWL